jgi:hypothetical protein
VALTAAKTSKLISASKGTVKTYTGSNPAGAAEVSETVPDGVTWELLAVTVNFVTATQAPWPALKITDGTNTVFQSLCGTAAITAGTTVQCSWIAGNVPAGAAATTSNQGGLPTGLLLFPGSVISTVSGTITNCDYAAPAFIVIERTAVS